MRKLAFRLIIVPVVKRFIGKVEGTSNISKNSSYLIVSNHNSVADGLGIGTVYFEKTKKIPSPITKFSPVNNTLKSRIIKNMFESFFKLFTDTISVWKKNVIDHSVKKLQDGASILIFPEGDSNPSDTLLKAKTGAARIALLSKVPVLPVGMRNSHKVLAKNSYRLRLAKGDICFGKPMTFERYYAREDDKGVLEEVTRIMMKEIAKLCKKSYPY